MARFSHPFRIARPIYAILPAGALLLTGCASAGTDAGWTSLVDGADLSQWRGYQQDHVPSSWTVEDGVIAFSPSGERGDLITRSQYADFDLRYEWKISEGGNSGVMIRVGEQEEHPWHTGPEMQVLDDERHPDGKIPSHRAGALYDLVVPPDGVTRPAGEWNQARIRAEGNHLQFWLNGHKTVDVVIGSDDWHRRLAQSKFQAMPSFATLPEGHIVLQDHDDPVWYRNIRIRPLGD